ncbi:DUF3221 domain-containing protein [Cytobacillus sp. IB215316]|uniref:DUF3221 domain-containing protein n=1 Tax=Cytobacillus sp. IB215316 TaxID=3097354 RepID=UPI002A167964|nr:DUF3221 domain-containing protein [Cytobacillus sp. IB215316]MDX8363000.1 DUF3221 domain-containing protein [Cytobacillus sp. IB215316]
MKMRISFLVFAIFVLLLGCNNNEEHSDEPDFIGKILEVEDKKILMDIEQGNFFDKGYTEEIILSYGRSVDQNIFEQGKEFKVWIDGEVLESNPPQGRIGKIEVNE